MSIFKFLHVVVTVAVAIALVGLYLAQDNQAVTLGSSEDTTNFTSVAVFEESVTTGGNTCTLTDANGGTYSLTDAELTRCSYLTFAAGGAGQAVISLALPATSTMKTTIPRAGMCKTLIYSAINLSAATTTTITAGTGHNVLAYTVADDVIDGQERAQLTLCRLANGNVDAFTTEILNAD